MKAKKGVHLKALEFENELMLLEYVQHLSGNDFRLTALCLTLLNTLIFFLIYLILMRQDYYIML